jgi:hypothetical protein
MHLHARNLKLLGRNAHLLHETTQHVIDEIAILIVDGDELGICQIDLRVRIEDLKN